MSLSLVTYSLSKKYTDSVVIGASEIVIDEAVRRSKIYTDQIAAGVEWEKEFVDTLPPAKEADEHTIYFVPASDQVQNDGYFEYMAVDGQWAVIGRTVLVMDNYYTKEEVQQYVAEHTYILPIASKNSLGGVKIDDESLQIDENGTLSIRSISSTQIQSLFT
jgi:hypothetical protein